MHSTTLITFLLRAPSNVTSVELLGSWDNFSRPYPMERDRRMGSGHWRGCHTFTDIVRDGHSPGQSPGRTGGLKMGGTYWYYYRLDGDTEYYNDVEPVTSLCPLLPGQPVNILSVPIILPDTDHLHRRDNSNSSVKSGKRTMDPEDKYMNPRTPPKPRPGLPRLKTSPPLYQQTAPSASMLSLLGSHDERPPVSQPISSTHSTMFRLVPRPKPERSQSPPRSKGLRAALLNITGARLPADYPEDHRYLFKSEDQPPMEISVPSTSTSNPNSSYSSRLPSPMNSPVELDGVEIGRLPFRNPQLGSDSRQELPSLRVRRASKSSREETPLALSLEPHSSSRETERPVFSRNDVLETLEERPSQQSTPVAVNSRDRVPSAADSPVPAFLGSKEKRLPTLPNSPSSVLDAELRAIEARYKPLDMDLLYSRFSDDTSFAVSKVYDSKIIPEKSRFSEWSTDAENDSPASMTSSSTFNADRSFDTSPMIGQDHRFQINSKVVKTQHTFDALLPIVDVSGPATPIFENESEIVLSPSKVDSDHSPIFVSAPIGPIPTASAAGEPDSPFIHQSFEFSSFDLDDYDSFHEPNPKRQGAILPLGVVSSSPADESSLHPMSPQKEQQYRLSDEYTSQSKAIQELIDEIGYLGDLISSGL